jgi:hypothetical protein
MSGKPRKAFDGVGRPKGIIDDVFGPLGKQVAKKLRSDVRAEIKYFGAVDRNMKRTGKYVEFEGKRGDRRWKAEQGITEAFDKKFGKNYHKNKSAMDVYGKAYKEERAAVNKQFAKRAKIRQSKGKK